MSVYYYTLDRTMTMGGHGLVAPNRSRQTVVDPPPPKDHFFGIPIEPLSRGQAHHASVADRLGYIEQLAGS